MSIDTENKRRNVARITTFMLISGLAPTNGLDTDDRENSGGGYIGFTYAEAPAAPETSFVNWLSPSLHCCLALGLWLWR